jgi:D-methionine transport system ATP-binding protein
MALIELKNVSKTFETGVGSVQALKDINLSIEQSDIYGIIGMSGAGKSTLVRCLNYLERPTDGDVIVGGKKLRNLSKKELREERRNISMIFQNFNLLMQKNVLKNVCFPLRLRRVKRKEAEAKAYELLETVGLKDKAKAYPAELSGGQKQRVAIARALASKPAIILADEPTGNLDTRTSQDVLGLLKTTGQKFNQTIVMITHNDEIAQMADRTIRIEDGHIV